MKTMVIITGFLVFSRNEMPNKDMNIEEKLIKI